MLILSDIYLVNNSTKTLYLGFYFINVIEFCNYMLMVNLMKQHVSSKLGQEQLKTPKAPVWNTPQVKRFVGNR